MHSINLMSRKYHSFTIASKTHQEDKQYIHDENEGMQSSLVHEEARTPAGRRRARPGEPELVRILARPKEKA